MANPVDGYSIFGPFPIGPVYANWYNYVPVTLPWTNDAGTVLPWYS